MARRPVTSKVIRAARRNIRRAQLSRVGTREVRALGRVTRSRIRYSRPTPMAGKIRVGRKR